jgi:hypothetical protein
MSDYWEERIPHSLVEAEALRNALGSLVAGVCSGYLSHIPHNLSTLKLMTPSKTYSEHLGALVSQSEGRVPQRSPPRRVPELPATTLVHRPYCTLDSGLGHVCRLGAGGHGARASCSVCCWRAAQPTVQYGLSI